MCFLERLEECWNRSATEVSTDGGSIEQGTDMRGYKRSKRVVRHAVWMEERDWSKNKKGLE